MGRVNDTDRKICRTFYRDEWQKMLLSQNPVRLCATKLQKKRTWEKLKF